MVKRHLHLTHSASDTTSRNSSLWCSGNWVVMLDCWADHGPARVCFLNKIKTTGLGLAAATGNLHQLPISYRSSASSTATLEEGAINE
jgi:hypothetical protein